LRTMWATPSRTPGRSPRRPAEMAWGHQRQDAYEVAGDARFRGDPTPVLDEVGEPGGCRAARRARGLRLLRRRGLRDRSTSSTSPTATTGFSANVGNRRSLRKRSVKHRQTGGFDVRHELRRFNTSVSALNRQRVSRRRRAVGIDWGNRFPTPKVTRRVQADGDVGAGRGVGRVTFRCREAWSVAIRLPTTRKPQTGFQSSWGPHTRCVRGRTGGVRGSRYARLL